MLNLFQHLIVNHEILKQVQDDNDKHMTQLKQIYKCSVCGNIVEVVHNGGGELVCCGQPMVLQNPNTVDAAREKHVPVIEQTETGYKVQIGSVLHPMEEAHFIEWIELIINGKIYRQELKPGDAPVAEFCGKGESVMARAYCNLHGLWQA
jgi:superoxide reductase